ncbi:hypothetical protein EDC04DRAFT_2604354 [Pisolithus marmoratus]|nr:hypothetical protein EDC04DRAFT_2604354 [Pisolithus marmoratus]
MAEWPLCLMPPRGGPAYGSNHIVMKFSKWRGEVKLFGVSLGTIVESYRRFLGQLEDIHHDDLIHGEDVEVHLQGDNENADMDVFPDYGNPLNFNDPHGTHRSRHDPDPGIYVDTYEGCMEAFPEQCQENSCFLWGSRQEWAFALWLLQSCLSMAAIDGLLLLEIMRNLLFSFCSAKELRTHAETLPSGPWWSLLSHPLFEHHISFVPRKVWTSAVKICHIYGGTATGCYSSRSGLVIQQDQYFGDECLLQDQFVHQALNVVLLPLKTAASVGVMMSNLRGNLHYCFTPLAVWIADMPEEGLLAGTAMKVSPITIATSKEFGDPFQHAPHTAVNMLAAIHSTCSQCPPMDYKNFLKAMRWFWLNGIVEPCWNLWPLSDPSIFLTPKVLHHFHWMFWDHDVKWCINVTGATELDFCFSIIQTSMGYWAFSNGISRLKQVTGHDHHAVQCYITAAVAGSIPCKFLIAIHALLDFCYLAQAPSFTTQSLEKIPKLELLQSVVPSTQQSGVVMQWSVDITEHAHIEEIKVLACAGNNQNYNNQIVCHLDWLDKCLCFDLAAYIQQHVDQLGTDNESFSNSDAEEGYELDGEGYLSVYSTLTHQIPDYFSISTSLLLRKIPAAPKPYHTFATLMTSFHLATKPSLWLTVDEASVAYQLPNLKHALATFFANRDTSFQVSQPAIIKLQIWHKLHWQSLMANTTESLSVHTPRVTGQEMHFNIVPQSNPNNVNPVTGMHLLRWAVQSNGQQVGEPLQHTPSPHTHLVMDSFPVSDSNEKTPQKSQCLFHFCAAAAGHVTLYNQQHLSSIHPCLRHRTDWFHTVMDDMVKNDTHETHWELLRDDSDRLLNFLFPDEVLFPKGMGELAKKSDHYVMEQVLNHCIDKELYIQMINPASGSSEEKAVSYWPGAPQLDTKPTACKGLLVSFFTSVNPLWGPIRYQPVGNSQNLGILQPMPGESPELPYDKCWRKVGKWISP